MKLVLANNQSERFISFYNEMRAKANNSFDYSAYESLLFVFDTDQEQPTEVYVGDTNLNDYDGVYLNGYLHTYELAAAMAICCTTLNIAFVNKELANPPSMSKLTEYAKLAANNVSIPRTVAGCKTSVIRAQSQIDQLGYPFILKRADADRGIDNFKVSSFEEMQEILAEYEPRSIWIAQRFVPNNGFYLMTFYDLQPKFCIFRSLEKRPDGNERKAHMYKPKGGANAHLIPLDEVPEVVASTTLAAITAMNRQIGSVDCLYDAETGRCDVLEVNYNPQLVTVETFKDIRIQPFLEGIAQIK